MDQFGIRRLLDLLRGGGQQQRGPIDTLRDFMVDQNYLPANQENARRSKMFGQMNEAQGISDAVRRQQPWTPEPSPYQLLPEFPVDRPWPGSPRNTRVG